MTESRAEWEVRMFVNTFTDRLEDRDKTIDTLRKRVQELEYRHAYLEKKLMQGVMWMDKDETA
jgi:hypothetical protein